MDSQKKRQIKPYVKRRLNFTELVAIVGLENATKLCLTFPGQTLPSPIKVLRARLEYAICREWEAGASFGELAMKFNVTSKLVYRIIKKYVEARDATGLPPDGEFDDK